MEAGGDENLIIDCLTLHLSRVRSTPAHRKTPLTFSKPQQRRKKKKNTTEISIPQAIHLNNYSEAGTRHFDVFINLNCSSFLSILMR